MNIKKTDLLSVSNRYIELYNSWKSNDYTNVRNNFSKLFLYRFFSNFKYSLEKIPKEIDDNIVKEINYNINRIHWWNFYSNNQDKINWETRKTLVPPIYSLINYEFLAEKIFTIIQFILKNNPKFNFLIEWEFFWYANQYVKNWSSTIKKDYIDLWKKFKESHKSIEKDSLRFVIKTDLKDFYDSISHDSIINELKIFVNNNINFNNLDNELLFLKEDLNFIWDSSSDFEKTFDYFLYKLSDVLFKINNNSNIWIPQNIIASDFISWLYIFIKIYNNLDELGLNTYNDKLWNLFFYKKENNNEIYFNNYSDDFVILTNDYIYWKKFLNDKIIKFFNKDWIKFNVWKTEIKKYDEYIKYDYIDLNFNKIFSKDKDEIKKFKDIFLNSLINKRNSNLKTLIKFFYLFNINDYLIDEVLLELEKLIKIDLRKKDTEIKNDDIELFLNLIRQSPKFSVQIFNLFMKQNEKNRYLNSYYKFIENFFSLLTLNTLWIILLKINYWNYWDIFREKIIRAIEVKKESTFFIDFLIDSEDYYSEDSLILKKYKWLCNFLFKEEYSKWDIRENNIWLMLDYIFLVNDSISEKLNNRYKWSKKDEPLYINELLSSLSFILEEMLREKDRNIFYLISPNFIADLHSLFNNLLSIIISLKYKTYCKCDMARDKNILNIESEIKIFNWNRMYLKRDLWFEEDEINLLHFVKKKRAIYVHKEREQTIEELKLKSFEKFNSVWLFKSSISSLILKMFNLIDKEI